MKKIINIFFEAVQGVLAYRLRTVLSVFSIGLGIGAVTLVVAVVSGAYSAAIEIANSFGPDTVMVIGGRPNISRAGHRGMSITLDDVRDIKDTFYDAYKVVPYLPQPGTKISYRDKHHTAFAVGATLGYSEINGWEMDQGRDLFPSDDNASANVCVLGSTVKNQLFSPDEDPIGKMVKVSNNFYCEVIGTLKPASLMGMRGDMNDRFVMPLSTVMKRIAGQYKYVMVMRVSFEDVKNVTLRAAQLESFMRKLHHIPEGEDDDFMVISPDMVMKFFFAVSGAIMAFIGVMTLLTISVGGFVMANMFLISVQERTKEIGIRRAFGATKADVFMQFLLEFGVLTVIGALLGFLLGAAGSKMISGFGIFQAEISINVFIASFVTSIVIALIFGTGPARKAASINPIDAIRSR